MADVITRLKVESTEYDSKIKRASQGLLQMEQACRKVGGTLAILEKDELEFVKGLGKMETVSKDARGQLNELTKAFTDLSLQYKRLTDEEKQGDFGKALESSLGELKSRIQDTKGQLKEINGEINGGGGLTGALDQLAGKFGLNIQQLAGWGAAIGAAKVALDVAKDAFFQSESNIDEWGRTVEGAKGAYDVFLDTLNNGNWSNFFSNLSTAVQGARDLYDSLDRLGSIKSNNAAAIAIVQQEIAKLRLLKQSGEDVDAQIKDATDRLAALQKQSVTAGKQAGRASIGNVIRNEYNSQAGANPITGGSINKAVDDILKNGQDAFDKYKRTFERLEKKAEETRTVEKETPMAGVTTTQTERYVNLEKLTDEERKQYFLSKAITEGETRIQEGIALYAQSVQEGTASAREEFKGKRYALTGSGGSGGGKTGVGGASTTITAKELSPLQQAQKEISALTEEALTADEGRLEVIRQEIAALQHQVDVYKQIQEYAQGGREKWNIQVGDRKAFESEQRRRFDENTVTPSRLQVMEASVMKEMRVEDAKVDTETLHSLLKDALQNSIDTTSLDLTTIAEQIGEGINVPDETWQGILDKYNELKEAIGEEPIKIDFESGKITEDGKKADKAWQQAASAVKSVGSAFSQIEDPGVKAIGTVMQAIASIALGFAQAASAKDTTASGWAWLAWLAAGTAAMATTIATVHSLTGFAEGGIVKGNSYSGDNIGGLVDGSQFVGLNAGELVLNASQQGTLAEALISGSNQGGGGSSTPYVTGEKIVMGINNYGRRAGLGELVFSK